METYSWNSCFERISNFFPPPNRQNLSTTNLHEDLFCIFFTSKRYLGGDLTYFFKIFIPILVEIIQFRLDCIVLQMGVDFFSHQPRYCRSLYKINLPVMMCATPREITEHPEILDASRSTGVWEGEVWEYFCPPKKQTHPRTCMIQGQDFFSASG